MKARVVGYWICTVVIAALMLSGGIMQSMKAHDALEGILRLGYPVHFVVLLGLWKIAGALVLVAPRLPLVKEWAYAGIVIDLTAASVAHVAASDGTGNVVAPLVFTAIAALSWYLRPASRRLAGVPAAADAIEARPAALAQGLS